MDNRPIGFFDSGLGGLTCIPYLLEKLPEERIIYFGDTARTPYGSKAISTIQKFSIQIAEFLVSHDVKMIVIACNTISATCLDLLREKFPQIQILGIIIPTAKRLAKVSEASDRIGVIGTKTTVKTHAYRDMIRSERPELDVFEQACPAFVPLIEEGIVDNDIMNLTIRFYLDDFVKQNRLDTLVLGCTHFPFIREQIQQIYPELSIVDPSEEVIWELGRVLEREGIKAENCELHNTFYASDLSENFVNMIDKIFGNIDVDVKFKNLDMEG